MEEDNICQKGNDTTCVSDSTVEELSSERNITTNIPKDGFNDDEATLDDNESIVDGQGVDGKGPVLTAKGQQLQANTLGDNGESPWVILKNILLLSKEKRSNKKTRETDTSKDVTNNN